MLPPLLLAILLGTVTFLTILLPRAVSLIARAVGWHLRNKTRQRRELLVARTELEKKQAEDRNNATSSTLDDEWERVDRSRSHSGSRRSDENRHAEDDGGFDGIIGFFHPFCNAGGGGERVLWAAIRATQLRYPNAISVVYTGDHDVTKEQMLKRVQDRFNIHLTASHIHFLYPASRVYILPSTWPHFTLLGQSLGSLILAYDSFSFLVPDIFIDTMGYSFTLALCKYLFPTVPVGAYVHYPTISTDMLESLDVKQGSGKGGVHVGKGEGWRGAAKKTYWRLFASLYGWTGGCVDVVMTNSSWTQGHIQSLWSSARRRRNQKAHDIAVVFPPCAVEEVEKAVEVSVQSEAHRKQSCIYIAQFRSEKNHALVLKAFARLLSLLGTPGAATSSSPPRTKTSDVDSYDPEQHPHLTLIGSVRDSADETHIYNLRLLAHELKITHAVTFLLNASWEAILNQLRTASVGINAMWNEHFGIGVVEYQAAGLLSVVNNSGGPRLDICRDLEEDGAGGKGRTGFHATTEEEYAGALKQALELKGAGALTMRLRARRSARRFDEESFEKAWVTNLEELVRLKVSSKGV